ncbi:storkhead-box protein 2 isoform X1 [Phycodurus eques]|uniref:storkhead-box protein 2 isoform X1 n=1 Tax=Phycodurus eques TaxID=693459 RepID=UPI002ACDFEFC|nr:storkhead-box protein 2 isoform X1 [Phycodurus eques]XP_061535397.1 storkhead-box protein 2 isoform X1 [Phycodurus eques]
MEEVLGIAPHSLAVVLSRVSGHREDENSVQPTVPPPPVPAGYQVFADFKATNMRHFWNQALTRALVEVFFLGWLQEHVLLISGREDHLQVLRNGWTRRTLKAPPGFHITSIGDVSPISMSPISQSQFIPLGEILCLAVSAMNAAHKPVSQEALVEHLTASFPGVPTPSLEVLRHTLNMLVRERKIYPTPEGYFIVTPQTYFITPSLIRSNNKWYHLDDRLQERQAHPQLQSQQCTSPKSGNVTPSTPGCLSERPSRKNHNDSYNSRRDELPRLQSKTPKEHPKADPQPSKTPKDHGGSEPPARKEHRGEPPSYPYPPPLTSPPVQQPPQDLAEKSKSVTSFPYKTDTLTKKKEGSGSSEKLSKRFGLRLFRLSFKKDKMRQLATFSAQFPPEEWPLRDEDVPAAPIPREIEMEIIRRINPDLTVENVARHTAVMKRLEEERTQKHKAGSSAQHSARSRRGRGHRRAPHGKSRSHSKPRTCRGEPSEGSNWDLLFMERDYRFFSHSLVRSPREAMYTLERRRSGVATYLVHSNPNITESYCPVTPEWDVSGELAKRRTEMPFPEPSRGTCQSRVQRSHSHNQDRKSRHDRSDQAKERSRSMDNSLKGPSLGPLEDFEDGPDKRGHYYTDDGTLRATQKSGHYSRIMFSAAKFHSDFNVPDLGKGSVDELRVRSTMERNKSKDSLPTYNELMGLSPKPSADEYFQCNTSNETILTAPSPQAKSEYDTLTSSGGRRKGSPADRQTPHLTSPHKMEYKEDLSAAKGQSGGGGSVRLTPSQTPEPVQSARLTPHQHNVDPGGGGGGSMSIKRKEIFSKDTLFKPPHNALSAGYADSSYTKSGTLRKASHAKSTEALDNPEPQQPSNSAASSASPVLLQGSLEPTVPSASFDYYNVSDDEDDEEAEEDSHKELAKAEDGKDHREAGSNGGGSGTGGGGIVGGGGEEGTIKWLLEREKEHHLQRKLETNLTLLSPKETENSSSQKSAHSARLDSMDSSSVTVDSGFNSPRTRESLASNTSSIVESNRRQNPALSPGHHVGLGGAGLPFSFRAIPEPPAPSQPDKLQKPANCLASITSV